MNQRCWSTTNIEKDRPNGQRLFASATLSCWTCCHYAQTRSNSSTTRDIQRSRYYDSTSMIAQYWALCPCRVPIFLASSYMYFPFASHSQHNGRFFLTPLNILLPVTLAHYPLLGYSGSSCWVVCIIERIIWTLTRCNLSSRYFKLVFISLCCHTLTLQINHFLSWKASS